MTGDYFEKIKGDSDEKSLSKKEKWTLGILCFLGVGILVFGFSNISAKLKVPLFPMGEDSENVVQAELNLTENYGSVDELKTKDSDNDGLPDYDELYFYGTSPYLEDTDSDGYTDDIEIEQGQDPNCPQGKKCYSSSENASEEEAPDSGADLRESLNFPNFSEFLGAGSEDIDPILMGLLSGEATAEDLRKILIQGGIPEEEVNKIDDKTLIDTYNESLGETYEETDLENLNQEP